MTVEVTVSPMVIEVSASPVVVQVQPIDPAKIGPPGPPGPAGEGLYETTADADLLGHRVVVKTSTGCVYADAENPSHAYRVVGVTLGSALTGETVAIRQSGTVTEPSWTFSPGPVWLSTAGQLTQTPIPTAFTLVVGEALTPTTLLVAAGVPIFTA